MLIHVGKIYTAFNLTPREMWEVLDILDTPAMIWPASFYIDPDERKKHQGEAGIPFTHELAQEYADSQTRNILKFWGPRESTIRLIVDHLVEMTQVMEKESSPQEWSQLTSRWLDPRNEGLVYEVLGRMTGDLKILEREVNSHLAGSYTFFAFVELEEVVALMHQLAYPLKHEVKGLTREAYQRIVQSHFVAASDEAVADGPQVEASTARSEQTIDASLNEQQRENSSGDNPELATNSDKAKIPRGAIPALLRAINDEADKHGLSTQYYVKSDRAIRYWLDGKATPDGFSADVLMSQETRIDFARKYIEAAVAKGSSELDANAKKNVALNPDFHAVNLKTPEDALLMSEAYKELAKTLPGGSKPEK